jgi:hypothetical protein
MLNSTARNGMLGEEEQEQKKQLQLDSKRKKKKREEVLFVFSVYVHSILF